MYLTPPSPPLKKDILGDLILHTHKHRHSYPYDWRTKKPCIIRSSMQWFIDTNQLKEQAIRCLSSVRVRPSSVSNSMLATLSTRPYWCISRQRSWGLPIPCFYDRETDAQSRQPILDARLVNTLKELIREEGNVDFWWSGKHDKKLEEGLLFLKQLELELRVHMCEKVLAQN